VQECKNRFRIFRVYGDCPDILYIQAFVIHYKEGRLKPHFKSEHIPKKVRDIFNRSMFSVLGLTVSEYAFEPFEEC
jgi:hypothetical protein